MARRLTDTFIQSLRPADKPYLEGDLGAPGLAIKIMPTGRRIWIVQVKLPGRKAQSKLTVGLYPSTGIAEARERAGEYWRQAKAGLDPKAQERAAAREAAAARVSTFGEYAERIIVEKTNRRAERDGREIRRMLIPAWRDTPLREITPAMVRDTIEAIIKRAPYDGANAWSHSAVSGLCMKG